MHTETYNIIIEYIDNQFMYNLPGIISSVFKKALFERVISILQFERYYTHKINEKEYNYLSGKLSNFLLYDNYEIHYEYNRAR